LFEKRQRGTWGRGKLQTGSLSQTGGKEESGPWEGRRGTQGKSWGPDGVRNNQKECYGRGVKV